MPVSELQDALRIGLAVVSEIWHHSTKSWVTSVAAADIDSDGDIEVLAGSRDGRVHVLTRWGDLRWDRIVGNKSWVGTLAVQPESSSMAARMLIGNREGMIFALDKDGKIVSPDGKLFAPGRQDWATEPDQEKTAYWLKSEQVIRQVVITEPTATSPSMIVAGSEDRRVYALDAESGKLLWTFPTQGPVRAICAADVNGDGEIEILAGSGDHYLYLLNSQGRCLHQHLLQDRQIYTIFAADIDHDQQTEILVGTDAKDLLVLTPDFTRKWSHTFSNRLLCLQVADLDNDGHNEIIAGSEDQHLYILDHQGNRLWRHHLGAGIFSLYAIDFDHDGQIELLVGSEDTRLHVLRIRLIRQLSRKIRRQYQQLGKPAPESLTELSPAEQDLLRDILDEERSHVLVKPATLEHVDECLTGGEHLLALIELLRLQQQKVQLRWCKDKPGHIRALYLGDISGDQQREVVIGSAEGLVQAFSAAGKNLWQLRLTGQILALQTGYLDHRKWQDILACSSDHHIYVISGTKKSITRTSYMNEWMSSFYLLAQERRSTPTVIVGTEDKKLCFYGRDLATPLQTISTPQGIKIVAAYDAMQAPRAPGEQIPEVIAGSLENTVTAYSRHGRLLWNYHTYDRVLAIAIKDLDGDGRVEIIIGSEDRNVHVLSNDGKLKWRYFTEHRVIAIDACDLDHDGSLEVLAGCGDGKLYVLSAQGDLLWSYQTNDRIRVVRAEDIDDDGHVEIALGSEDRLELLSVIDQEKVSEQIAACWQTLLQDRNTDEVITTLLTQQNPLLRAFALRKFAERADFAASDMLTLKDLVKDGARQVRLSLTYAAIHRYSVDPEQATALLNQLSTSWDRALRVAFVAQLPALTQQNWELGLEYLERFLRNQDRFVRRTVIRQITQLIPTVPKSLPDALFQLVLLGLNDEESRWIRQESARAFARFLDRYHKKIILYLYYFITNCSHYEILHLIAFHTRNPQATRLFSAMSALLTHLYEVNTQSRIDDVVNGVVEALAEIRTLAYGQDSWLLYREFARLLSLHTIEGIADYQCGLHLNQFSPQNEYVPLTLHILERFDIITRLLTIYLHRTALNDQLNSLLEASAAIEHLQEYLEQQYAGALPGENIVRLPDRRLFEIILKQWSATIKAAFGELSGRPDLHAALKTTSARREEAVTVQLLISNRGRSSANQVKTTLLSSSDFTVIGPDSLEIGPIFPQEAVEAEFTIRPRDVATLLTLAFETVYYEEFVNGKSESPMKWLPYEGHLELTAPPQEFKHIPNPYSTGTPTRDKNMFYGRANDIAFLKDNLTRTEAKSVIVLYGQRRSGKTTLLRHLVNTSVLGEHIPVLIDMQEEEYKITVSKFLYHVAHYIYQALRKKDMQLLRPEKAEFTSDPTFAFNLFLDEVEAHLSGQKIVLLLDEFEVLETQVEKKQLEAEIFPYLRSLMQHRQSLNFVLSGTHEMGQLLRGYWSVFFNIAHHHRLSRLAPQDTEDLITRPVAGSLEYEAHAIQKIRMLTGDQPYLIHLVCRSLIDLCNSRHKAYATIHDVNTVQQDVMQTGQFHFDWIWDQITVEEQMALSAIAEGRKEEGRLISFSEIEDLYRQHHLPLKRGVLLAAIKRLSDLDVVEDDGTQMAPERKRYRISVGLIGKWLRKEKALESLRQQLT
jgi:outer membrane protein assembly factor BamB